MKIQIIPPHGLTPCVWRLWQGNRCLAWGTAPDKDAARAIASAAKAAANRKHVQRWPARATAK